MCGTCGCSAEGERRLVQLELDVLAKNKRYAEANRRRLAAEGTLCVNLLSGPGAGKTTLLVRSIADLCDRRRIAVIEGDQETSIDADRIVAAGARAVQVNTGKGCHLDAHMVGHAIERVGLADDELLFVENVGNLVCPTEFDLGEDRRVVLLSVTEGDDKPLKYPGIFASADLVLATKVDLLPHVAFDVALFARRVRDLRPGVDVLGVSAVTGAGLDEWYERLGAWQPSTAAAFQDA